MIKKPKDNGIDRITSSKLDVQEEVMDITLRPKTLAEYIGQSKIKESIRIFIEAARRRGEALEHCLLYGPPGIGKTTLALILGNELDTNTKITSGPAIERAGDLAAILTNLEKGDVLFIDEIHRLNKTVEEIMYPAMEDGAIDIMIGKGPGARSMRIDLNPFTIIGATTKIGSLSSPLRGRFGNTFNLDFYTKEEIEQILKRSAGIIGVEIDDEAIRELASRSRRTPRVANRLLRRTRDFAQVKHDGKINRSIVKSALEMLDIDELGLDKGDKKILFSIIDKFDGGPVGLDTLAAANSEERETIEDVYEPYLLQIGFIERTPRGRKITRKALEYFSLKSPEGGSQDKLL